MSPVVGKCAPASVPRRPTAAAVGVSRCARRLAIFANPAKPHRDTVEVAAETTKSYSISLIIDVMVPSEWHQYAVLAAGLLHDAAPTLLLLVRSFAARAAPSACSRHGVLRRAYHTEPLVQPVDGLQIPAARTQDNTRVMTNVVCHLIRPSNSDVNTLRSAGSETTEWLT